MKVYKPEIKKFLGHKVRVITVRLELYIVIQDVFEALGRLDNKNQITSRDRKRLNEFLEIIGKSSASTKCTITSKSKKSKSRETQEVSCIPVELLPVITTQFKPTNSKYKTKEENEQILNEWAEFMIWVDNLLQEHKAYEVILKDKEEQKTVAKTITEETDGKMVVINTQISIIMAKLIGVYDKGIKKINKDELKIYQPQVTIDLIEIRQEALKIFEQQYLVLEDYKQASDFTVAYMQKKYHLDDVEYAS